ncbi:MAG: hypothetical protein IKS59_06585 [Aeriscardovia sp.]|nr:hypothetical protein [Aeriscardovia sp.]
MQETPFSYKNGRVRKDIMASNELIRAFDSYKNYYDRHGADETLVNACIEAAKTAFFIEKDEKYGLGITSATKGYINEIVQTKTGAGFFDLERYAIAHDIEYTIINSGYDVYRLESFSKFESYMHYIERDRRQEKRFYLPRRCTLRIVANDMQRLEDDELDEYGLSLPSRTGKSSICIFFLSWVGVRKPNSHSAMGGHSGQLAKRFFRGLDNIIETPDYRYEEVFHLWNPEYKAVLQAKSSDPAEFTLNLGSPDEFSTFTCRGIDGTWTGAIDVSSDGYLYVDDLIRDREHSLSPSRVENTYQEYQNKMLDRMNDGAKKMLVGTLWTVNDPLERERKLNENNPRALFRKIPALDENDESNFQYTVKGFSTQYYRDMRDRLDKAEWMAKFQQQPFVREGLTYPIEELRFFDGFLPVGNCSTIAHIDVAFGGGDRLSMPICKDFGEEKKYIVGWIHDSRSPGFTVPRVVDAIDRYYITKLFIEKNSGGQLYAEKVSEEMKNRGINHCKIELYSAPNKISKNDKISGYSDYVKRNFLFLSAKSRDIYEEDIDFYKADADYRKALDEMTTFSIEGKGKQFDDSPDSISSLAMKMDNRRSSKARIISSPL